MAVAGESVGGDMSAALALMAKERGDVTFVQVSMYYPVTDAAMNTASYEQFATGYYLTRKAMEWFWDAYTTDPKERAEITASPNQASIEQLTGLPPTYLCVDEADPLRDEGEAYAAKLRSAGVPVTTVRYNGTIHDFMRSMRSRDPRHASRHRPGHRLPARRAEPADNADETARPEHGHCHGAPDCAAIAPAGLDGPCRLLMSRPPRPPPVMRRVPPAHDGAPRGAVTQKGGGVHVARRLMG
jgi:acetyl esterase/lipase